MAPKDAATNIIMKKITLLFLLCLPFICFSQTEKARSIPQWIKDKWAAHTHGDGIWVTDNAPYKNEQEPFDAYGMEWEWGLGKSSLKGRLYCIQNGKDVGTVWQFLNFWDPELQQQRMIQIGSNGILGQGSIELQDDGSTKSSEKFTGPGGRAFEVGHHSWFENGEMHTQSFDIADGKWSKRRFYVWKQPTQPTLAIQDEFQKIAWLIGDWHSSFDENRSARMEFSWAENQRMIKYVSAHKFEKDKPEELEAEGIITYHGTKQQLIFMNTYLKKNTHLISEGRYEFLDNGQIHRLFTCHYKEGDGLPWSDGAKAPKGGKSIEFKQIWTPIDEDSFTGDFFWEKDGKWERPIKEKEGKKVIWKRR